MNPIGIMQGRLSPPSNGRIQSFPVETWRSEFELAKDAGLACIEWIYESGTNESNPICTEEGIKDVRRLSEACGVEVRSICADYFMADRLINRGGSIRADALEHLKWLLRQANMMSVRYIVLPFVDSSSLEPGPETDALIRILYSLRSDTEDSGVELHLETDLEPKCLLAILEALDHPFVRANYDIGNSAALAHDPEDELGAIGPWLGSVHVKDRIKGGHTVALGTGSA
ncbi:MAG TPA: TIM barrel protein, partial [Pyrinomonadaceae bacterium]|nr:TIM barrel protein [Pyrinomonadaceae bacterium]